VIQSSPTPQWVSFLSGPRRGGVLGGELAQGRGRGRDAGFADGGLIAAEVNLPAGPPRRT
jgi:hypothetical protein